MKKQTRRFRRVKFLLNVTMIAVLIAQSFVIFNPVTSLASQRPSGGLQRFIVRYKGLPVVPQRGLTLETQADQLKERSGWLSAQLSNASGYTEVVSRLSHLPLMIVEADAEGEESLRANPNVVGVVKDTFMKPMATNFVAIPDDIGGTAATGFSDGTNNFTGDGYAVAVIDSGITSALPNFTGQIISEACYSDQEEYVDATVTSVCPGGAVSSVATGSAEVGTCTDLNDAECWHGSAVSAVMAGTTQQETLMTESVSLSGVAKDSKLIVIRNAITIQEKVGQADWCGDAGNETETCVVPWSSGVLEGLNRVIALASDPSFTTPIAAVNVSQGLDSEPAQSDQVACDQMQFSSAFNLASSALSLRNIAVVAASGNSGDVSGNEDKIMSPACATGVISVGSSTKNGKMASYSNAGGLLDLVALGGEISGTNADGGIALPTSISGSEWVSANGTSFAAPQVAAAFAVMREQNPTLSTASVLKLLQDSGTAITEDRVGYTALVHKELDLAAALAASVDMPNITTFTGPSGSVTAGSIISLNLAATNANSCVIGTNTVIGSTIGLTNGSATTTVTVPTTGNSVTYIASCYDDQADEYLAQSSLSLAIAGGNTVEPPVTQDPGGSGGLTGVLTVDDQWVPGTPKAGVTAAQRLQAIVIASLCLAALLLFNKSQFSHFRR